ncbi:MAG TPA: hypothetical protein VF768_03730 [Holophagaceae bacterium]
MSDAAVLAAVQAMEAWLDDPDRAFDAPALEAWNRDFREAVATAERGPGWEALVVRAHVLAEAVLARQRAVEAQRDAVRAELEQQAQGDRALKGYGASTR